jgi:hypothetical protein
MRSSSLLVSVIIALLLFCGSQTLSFANAETAFMAISRDEIDDIDLEEVVSVDPFLASCVNRVRLPILPLDSGQIFVCLLPLVRHLLCNQHAPVTADTIRQCITQESLSNQPIWLLLCTMLL